MDLTIWGYIFGGATIFGLIVGIFSVYNGRMTRREISNLIVSESKATRDLISTESEATRELISSESEATRKLISSESEATRKLISSESESTRKLISSELTKTRELIETMKDILRMGKIQGAQA